MPLARLLPVALVTFVAACGFQLRGSQALPYDAVQVAVPAHSEFGVALRRAIRATGATRIVESADEAQGILVPTADVREKTVQSYDSAGRVREFQLRYRFAYRLHDRANRDLIPPGTITMTRDYSFSDSAVLAKEQEELLLWRDMEADLVQQLVRRLAATRPLPPPTE